LHYSVTVKELSEMAAMVAGALSGVRPSQETVNAKQADPREMIMAYIRTASGPRGVTVEEIIEMAAMRALSRDAVLATIESLIVEDECYQPQKGYVKLL
jgi:hypothetical protein